MTDQRLRELERQFSSTNDLEDELVWLHNRIRADECGDFLLGDCLTHFIQKPSEGLAEYIRRKMELTLDSNKIYAFLILFKYLNKEKELDYEIIDDTDCLFGVPIHIITNEDISDKLDDFKKSRTSKAGYPRFDPLWVSTITRGGRVRVNSLGTFHVKYNEEPTQISLNLTFDYAIAPISLVNRIINLFRN